MKRSWAKAADVRRLHGKGLSVKAIAYALETCPSVVLRILARGSYSHTRIAKLSKADADKVKSYAKRLSKKSLSP